MAGNSGAGMADLWHYAVGSERKGPVTQATLGKLLAAGEISAETYVWQPGMDSWVHLGDAAALKALVTGVGADRPVEAFVEEDTAFTSQDELLATHSALAGSDEPIATAVITGVEAVDDDGGISEDTVVESVDEALGAAGVSLASAMGVSVEEDAVVVEPEPTRADPPAAAIVAAEPIAAEEIATEADPFAALDALDELSDAEPQESLTALVDRGVAASAGAPAASASGVDIFGDADTDDIFAAAAPAPAPAQGVGKHSRHANSVLFSLDELGRDDTGAASRSAGADDPFLTDSSGLIDIKAIADSQQGEVEHRDPFGSAGLVAPPRPAMGTIAVPIVERRSSLGPWILAAAALLVIGGAIVAFVALGGDKTSDPAGPALVASATVDGGAASTGASAAEEAAAKEAAAQEAAAQEAAAQEAAAQEAAAKEAAAKEAAAQEAEEAAAREAAAKEGDDPEEVAAGADGPGAGEGASGDGGDEKAPEVAAAPPRRATTPRKPRPAPDPPPAAAVVEAPRAATVTTPSTGNTRKVNALLEKLNQPSEGGAAPAADTGGLPSKLSAAALRQTLRQNRNRFSRCGEMVEGSSGPVKVSTSFVILGASGEVQSARVVNAGGTSPAVQRCVVEELRKTTFGRFADTTMTVNFPIQLL